MASHGDEQHATASPTCNRQESAHVAQSTPNHHLAPPSISFPTSKVMQTPIPSVASRKALLMEKFGGGKTAVTTPSPPKLQPWTPPVLSQPDWSKLVMERRERKDTMASTVSGSTLPARLSPMPTGSTVASTAVDPAALGYSPVNHLDSTPSRTHSFSSTASRVRLAIMTINAMDKSVENAPTWRVGVTDEQPASRSWSRMSGASKFGEGPDISWTSLDETFAEEEEENQPSPADSASSSEPTSPKPPLTINPSPTFTELQEFTIDTPQRHEFPRSSVKDDVPFDTHPPNMVSPRTGLAYVVLPPWARRRSSVDVDAALSASTTVATTTTNKKYIPSSPKAKQEEETVVQASSEEEAVPIKEAVASLEEKEVADAPLPLPKPVVRRSTPVILRGTARRTLSTSHGPGNQGRATAVQHRQATPLPQPARPHGRSTSLSQSHPPSSFPTRFSAQTPTQFWTLPQHLRERRSSYAMPAIPDEPLLVKPQNKVPLRKVTTKAAPRPMRFSMAL